jgi:hypothetical protein
VEGDREANKKTRRKWYILGGGDEGKILEVKICESRLGGRRERNEEMEEKEEEKEAVTIVHHDLDVSQRAEKKKKSSGDRV